MIGRNTHFYSLFYFSKTEGVGAAAAAAASTDGASVDATGSEPTLGAIVPIGAITVTLTVINLVVLVVLVVKCQMNRKARCQRKEKKKDGASHVNRVEAGTIKSFHSLSSKFGPPSSSCDERDCDSITTASSMSSLPDA